MAEKEFKTIEEQIEILRSRGLSIQDDEQTKQFLLYHNYYRISGYSLTLRRNDVFYPNSSMQNVMDIYAFDHEMRHLLLKHIEIIEVKMKSVYAYEFAQMYGCLGYRDESLFTNADQHGRVLGKAEDQRRSRLRHEPYLKHFEELGQDLPIWAYVDLLTIADISFLYKISRDDLRKAVAERFVLHPQKGDELLGRFMHSMTILRNLCAHGSRLYNRIFQQKPHLSRKEQSFLRMNQDGRVNNAHLYGFLFIMKRMLSVRHFDVFRNELKNLTKKFPFVNLRYYGFREDWDRNL